MTNIFVFLTIFLKQQIQKVVSKTHLIVTSLLIFEVTTNRMEFIIDFTVLISL